MSVEQSFSSQVEAVMQRGRRGAENPQDAEVLADITRLVEQSQVAGESILTQMISTSTQWRAAIETLQAQYNHDFAKQDVLDRVARALPIVSRESLLDQAGIPLDVNPENSGEHSERLDGLRRELRQLARHRYFAELTDPQTHTTWSRSGNTMEGHVDRNRDAILPEVGMSGSLNTSDYISRWMQRKPKEEEWLEHRANNRVLTEAMIARFLDGSPLEFSRVSGAYQGSTIDYAAPPHEAMRDRTVREKYQQALVTLLDGLDADTDWSQENREQMRQSGAFATNQLGRAHETFVSHLFDGIDSRTVLRPGQDLRMLLQHTDRSDPDGARTASFARGAALRILVEGGDAMSYTVAVGTLPDKDKVRLAEVVRQNLASTQDASERARLEQLLRDAHGDQAERAESADSTATIAERASRETMAQQARQATREQLEQRMLTTSINSLRGADLPSELQYALERSSGDVPRTMQSIGRNLAWAYTVEGLFMQELEGDLTGFVDGTKTLSGYSNHATQLHTLLDRLSEVKCSNATLSMSSNIDRALLEPNMRRILVLTRLAGLILSDEYITNQGNMAYLMARTFHNAETLGLSQQDILDVYNSTIVAVAKHNEAVATVAPDHQISMQDGLALALQKPRDWSVTNDYNSPKITLPETVMGNDVDAPGITSSSISMTNGARTDGRISMICLRGAVQPRQNGQLLEQETQEWAQGQIKPLAQTVNQVKKAQGYPETVSTLAKASTRQELERVTYDPPREIGRIPDTVVGSIKSVEDGVKNLSHLAEIDASEKVLGNAVGGLLAAITAFQKTHGADLANPPKKGIFTNHSGSYKVARSALETQSENVWKALSLEGKAPKIASPSDLSQLEQAVQAKVDASKNAELVALRQALEALDQAIPSPEDRALRFLAEHTQPPYEPSAGHAAVEVIKIPPSQARVVFGGKTEYSARDLLVDSRLSNSVAQALVRGYLVHDHGWSKPIHERVATIRTAAKSSGRGTELSKEVNDALFAIEKKLTTDAGTSFNVDRSPVTRQVLLLLKENIQPLLSDATLSTADTSAVAPVAGGELKMRLDHVVQEARQANVHARQSLEKWQI